MVIYNFRIDPNSVTTVSPCSKRPIRERRRVQTSTHNAKTRCITPAAEFLLPLLRQGPSYLFTCPILKRLTDTTSKQDMVEGAFCLESINDWPLTTIIFFRVKYIITQSDPPVSEWKVLSSHHRLLLKIPIPTSRKFPVIFYNVSRKDDREASSLTFFNIEVLQVI